jgi:hypothetical protein
MCKFVGLGLSLYMNERGGSAFPSVATLATDLSLAERTVRLHLNEHLHPQGWLHLVERGGRKGDRKRANTWQASTPASLAAVAPDPGISQHAPRHLTTATPAPGAAQVVHELDKELANLVCRECGEAPFTSMQDLEDHQEFECPALRIEDGTFEKAREELRKAGGRG